jgi:formylglycine-generating enzyme required for sulfatase activity
VRGVDLLLDEDTDPVSNTVGRGKRIGWYKTQETTEQMIMTIRDYLTDVGAFSGSGSFYGTFDQSGNVYQWNDLDGTSGSSRGLRGGGWDSWDELDLSSVSRRWYDPSDEKIRIGFRLASPVSGPSGVPEIDPNGLSAALGLIAAGLGLLERRRYGR